jgi:hypothetical protein
MMADWPTRSSSSWRRKQFNSYTWKREPTFLLQAAPMLSISYSEAKALLKKNMTVVWDCHPNSSPHTAGLPGHLCCLKTDLVRRNRPENQAVGISG